MPYAPARPPVVPPALDPPVPPVLPPLALDPPEPPVPRVVPPAPLDAELLVAPDVEPPCGAHRHGSSVPLSVQICAPLEPSTHAHSRLAPGVQRETPPVFWFPWPEHAPKRRNKIVHVIVVEFMQITPVSGIHGIRKSFGQEARASGQPEQVDEPTARTLVEAYTAAKDLYVRNLCLRLLYDKTYAFLEDFFEKAFRKKRYLDMRVLALRGLAQFRGEQALAGMLAKINEILRKRASQHPTTGYTLRHTVRRSIVPRTERS